MEFKSKEELKSFILGNGCFDEKENLRIYHKFFRGSSYIQCFFCLVDEFQRKRVLDVGCSYGHFLIHFPQGSAGVEINPRMIEFARGLGLEAISANIEDCIPVESSSFDIVFCNAVLEHMVSPHKLLLELHRILKPAGNLIVGVPNMDAMGYGGWKALEHLYAYNKKSLIFLLERSGFKRIKVYGNTLFWLLSHINYRIYEKLPLKFSPNLIAVAGKDPEFKYPDKRLEIFRPSWLKT